MTTRTKRIALLIGFAGVIVALRLSGVTRYLTLDNVQQHRQVIEAFIGQRYLLSAALFVAVYLVATACSLPGGAVLTLAGGFFFGVVAGTLLSCAGATMGATLAFLISRYILGNWLQGRYAVQLSRFNAEIGRHGHLYLLFVRLVPVFPFFLINLLSGVTRLPARTFVWTTLVGILPGGLVYAFAGSQLGTISSARDVFSPGIVAAFAFLALLAILPVVYTKLRSRTARPGNAP